MEHKSSSQSDEELFAEKVIEFLADLAAAESEEERREAWQDLFDE